MTITLLAELLVILVITLYASYLTALLDMWLIKRRVRKQVEQQRLINTLQRRYD